MAPLSKSARPSFHPSRQAAGSPRPSVMSSPNILAMLPRLISSIISTNLLSFSSFRSLGYPLENTVVQLVSDLADSPIVQCRPDALNEVFIGEVLMESHHGDLAGVLDAPGTSLYHAQSRSTHSLTVNDR